MVPRLLRLSFVLIALLVFSILIVACGSSSDREQMLEATVNALQTRVVRSESPVDIEVTSPSSGIVAPTSSPAITDTITNPLGILIDQYMQDNEKPFSGTVMVVREGEILIKKGYGLADREHGVPNSPETKFGIGSITKSFTAAAIMLLQEQGYLSVEDSICKYISECPEIWEQITLHHLLTHSSGLRNSDELDTSELGEICPCQEYDPEELIPYVTARQLLFSPGERFHYSNPGYFLLGVVIEEVSGKSYEDFILSEIMQPLGMSNSGYDRDSAIVTGRASGYRLDDITYHFANAPCTDVSLSYSAGAIFSTVDDLFLWDQALFSDQLVSEESLKAIYNMSGTNPRIFEDTTAGYGWEISDDMGHHVIEHGGQTSGFTAYLSRYPDDQVTIIVLSNFGEEAPYRISRNIARIVFDED